MYFFDLELLPQCGSSVVHIRLPGPPSPWSLFLNNLKKLVPLSQSLSSLPYEVCELSKHHRTSFHPRVESSVSHPFQLVHLDI